MHEARAVEQDVDLRRAGGGARDGAGIKYVEREWAYALGRQLRDRRSVDVGGDDVRALGRERERGGAPDALAGGRHERGLASEPSRHCDLPRSLGN